MHSILKRTEDSRRARAQPARPQVGSWDSLPSCGTRRGKQPIDPFIHEGPGVAALVHTALSSPSGRGDIPLPNEEKRTGVSSRIRVFIVDDHPLMRLGLSAVVNAEPDMEVLGECDNEADALLQLRRSPPEVVVVDLRLRAGCGLELIKQIRAFQPKIKILVVSFLDESYYAERALRAGASGYVMKQDVLHAVVKSIRRVHSGKLSVSEAVVARMPSDMRGAGLRSKSEQCVRLSRREIEVARRIGAGATSAEIAVALGLSIKTVETHRARIVLKAGLANASKLVQYCVREFPLR